MTINLKPCQQPGSQRQNHIARLQKIWYHLQMEKQKVKRKYRDKAITIWSMYSIENNAGGIMMKNKPRRTLSAILTLAMVTCLVAAMPITAVAADPPAAPSGLTSLQSQEGPKLTWKDNSDNEDGFIVERKEEGSSTWSELHPGKYSIAGSGTVGANVTTYTDTSAEEGKLYTYRVRAYNGMLPFRLYSAWSNERTHRFWPQPSELTAVAVAGGIALSWKSNTTTQIGFRINRKEGSGSWELLDGNAPANATTYLDTTAEVGKTYSYTVQAKRIEGISSPISNEATATMVLVPMVAPSNLTATANAGGITLNWQDNSDNEEIFSIYKKEGSGSFILLLSVVANTTAYTDATAEAGKTYTYYVRSVKVGVPGADSNEATATMPVTYTVTFNTNGGSAVAAQIVNSGGTAAQPSPNPTKTGFTFDGWYYDAALATAYVFTTPVTADIVLFAKWDADAAPGDAEPPSTGSMSNFAKIRIYTPGMFNDVNEDAWYGYNDMQVVANAYEYGLMSGNPDNTFNPAGNMSLAEAITVAARIHSIYMTGTENFVQGIPWYQVYVDYALANGIVVAGDFTNYSRAATRAEIAYIFSRALPPSEFALNNTVNSLPDVNSGTPYYSSIITLYKAGVLTGNDDAGTFAPGSNINRAQAAAIISRVILPSTRISSAVYG